MHSRDRRWPIVYLPLVALIPVIVVILVFPTSLVTMAEQIDWTSLETYANLMALIAWIVFCSVAVVASFRARQREQRRAGAIAGDETAMPLASIELDLPSITSAADAMREPLTLRWADSSIIVATGEGLLWRRTRKRDILIVWHEARLFETGERFSPNENEKTKAKRAEIFQYRYCLYANMRKFIEWTDAPTSSTTGEQLSWQQKDHLQRQLLAMVHARTSLPLREVARISSGQVPADNPGHLRWIYLLHLALLLPFAAIPLTTGVLAITAPLTRTLALNLYVAILCGGTGLALVSAGVWALFRLFHPWSVTPPPPAITLPTANTGNPTTIIRFGLNRWSRLLDTLLLIYAVVSSVYILFRSITDFPSSVAKHASFHDPHSFLLPLFFMYACIGVVFISSGVFSRAEQRCIDNEGLYWGRGKKRQSIPWVDVAMLKVEVAASGRLTSFKVIEAPPQSRTITWPADARWVQRPDGVSPDNAGAQFAAIVAQRAGIQPTAAWE